MMNLNKTNADSTILSSLKACPLFKGISDKMLNKISSVSKIASFQADEFIMHEGEIAQNIYIIHQGEVELLKKNKTGNRTLKITTLGKGEFIAGLSILHDTPRENSIRVKKTSTIVVVPLNELKNMYLSEYRFLNKLGLFSEEKKLFSQIAKNLTQEINKRIHHLSLGLAERELKLARTRINSATLLLYMIFLLSIYTITLDAVRYFASNLNSTIVGLPILAMFSFAAYDYLKKTKYPLSFFGITWKGASRAVTESILFTLPILLLLFIFKYAVIHFLPSYEGLPLFDFTLFTGNVETSSLSFILTTFLIFLAYLTLIPLQEFLYRGILQSSLQEFLIGRFKITLSIFGSSLVFAVTHIHISIALTLLTFVLGFFWGWMYYRQKTLIGISVSHLLIALWGTILVGPGFALLNELI